MPDRPLSDRTWLDLELNGIFARVDHCNCPLGQQVLYDLMRRPLADPADIDRRDRLIRAISGRPEVRAGIERAAQALATSAAYDVFRLTAVNLPERPKWWPLLPTLGVTSAASLGIMLFSIKLGFALLLSAVAANIAIQVYYRPRIQHLLRPISALPNVLAAAKELGRIELPEIHEDMRRLRRDADRLRWVRGTALHLQRDSGGDPMGEMIAGYANLLFLADINAFVFSIEQIKRFREEIESLMHTVGMLDAMCAVAEFRRTLPVWCTPELDEAGATTVINGTGIYHPLLDDPVPNDFVVNGRPWLVTGSNMAGKTTYIRSAGACILLGRTLATCPAVRWQSPMLDVHTLIDRKDDLLGGKSYFLVEAEHVREMIDASVKERRCLFLIDELFRGTNTPERLSAARGVLAHMNRAPHVCVVSTHDLELIDLLGEPWEPWHFEERDGVGEMHFDYRIRRGAATAGNALKVLEGVGYPPEVMDTAYATFGLLAAVRSNGPASQRDDQRGNRELPDQAAKAQ